MPAVVLSSAMVDDAFTHIVCSNTNYMGNDRSRDATLTILLLFMCIITTSFPSHGLL